MAAPMQRDMAGGNNVSTTTPYLGVEKKKKKKRERGQIGRQSSDARLSKEMLKNKTKTTTQYILHPAASTPV